MRNKDRFCCPKCKKYIKPWYMKPNCPHCGVSLLYYKMDSRLEQDAENAEKEVAAVKRFLNILKESSVSSPFHIFRLVLFFLPLATMCLPMFWAGHKKVSLITFIMSIVNYGLDVGAMSEDLSYLFAALSIICVVVFSLAVIIASLFSAGKNGYRRNVAFSIVNTLVLGVLAVLVCAFGGRTMIGFYLTIALYVADFVLHFLCNGEKGRSQRRLLVFPLVLCLAISISTLAMPKPAKLLIDYAVNEEAVNVVSFNVASAFGTGFEDTDSMDRCDRFVAQIKELGPDLIGTQEINSLWLEKIESELSEYQIYAVPRGGDSDEIHSEMNAVMWNTLYYEIVDANTFWLSQTSEKESKFAFIDENGEEREIGCNRICSYVILDEKATGKRFAFMNTHLDNSNEQARIFAAGLIMEKMSIIRSNYGDIPVILTGDFNETIDDEALQSISAILNDTTDWTRAKATYRAWGYRNTGDKPIDYIFTTEDFENYTVIENLSNGYISDHYGIMVDIMI